MGGGGTFLTGMDGDYGEEESDLEAARRERRRQQAQVATEPYYTAPTPCVASLYRRHFLSMLRHLTPLFPFPTPTSSVSPAGQRRSAGLEATRAGEPL